MTSIPLGVIDNLSIERGSEQFGFNKNFLPLSLNVSFSIKDLTGAMPMGSDMPILGTTLEGLYQYVAKTDSDLTDYLGTLGGISLHERLHRSQRRKRAAELIWSAWTQNPLNAARLGQELHEHVPGFGLVVKMLGSRGLPN